jgi:pilus assembly protein FimV
LSLKFRFSLAFLLAAVSGAVSAIGLGDLRGQPALGDRFSLAVNLLGVKNSPPDASCFQLVRPQQEVSLPWLRDAALRVVHGPQPLLEIHSAQVLREPIMQLAVHVSCGYEIQREYTLLASPRIESAQEQVRPVASPSGSSRAKQQGGDAKPLPGISATSSEKASRKSAVPASSPAQASAARKEDPADRLMLSSAGDAEPASRLEKLFAQQLMTAEPDAKRRELLQQEFRMLLALQEKANKDAEATEKLSTMEAELLELRENIQGLSDGVVANSGVVSTEQAVPQLADVRPQERPPVKSDAQSVAVVEESSLSDWMLYGLLIGILLGVAGWLSWHIYRDRVARRALEDEHLPSQKAIVKLDDGEEVPRSGAAITNNPVHAVALAVERDDLLVTNSFSEPLPLEQKPEIDPFPIGNASLEDDLDVSPVMELADIMLSFGRVKGAAQALQEFVDNNPQEALQPWIRLMDVYRMAGMREEFEHVARNLNRNFNVEIQSWEAVANATASIDPLPSPESGNPVVLGVEDMPGIISSLVRVWGSDDVVGYLHQLLRDNRSGQRQGFPLPVVEDILFLIELKETSNRMTAEAGRGN